METQQSEPTYNTALADIAQRRLCKENSWPHFAPSGNCYKCHQNIYQPIEHTQGERRWTTGISVERAGSELITGCPHCHRSYCD